MEETPLNTGEAPETGNGGEEQPADDKALKKTYQEFREEARRNVLSSADREKYETCEPDEREFIDVACLFEFNSQQVNKTKRKVKLRDILLCRDIAQAYCPSRDMAGQYSEGMRILKNSEAGSETVKFVLARKICSMLERIHNLYSSHPRSYASADLHRAETELLNYTSRLGKTMRDPLTEARRIYVKLKERTGWEIPASAFGNAEGCDVPQLFFNRYSDSSQLLLKDPLKPFRSDTLEPPLRLDYRIKNAVLIMAGENRFHVDKKKIQALGDSATLRAVALKAVAEARGQIKEGYEQNQFELSDKLEFSDDFNVRSVKENVFNFLYGYTLKNLPNTASRADAAELFVLKLMEEENDIGCSGFCLWAFPPVAVNDEFDPTKWGEGASAALKLRAVFRELATGDLRLAMFSTRMNGLLTEYLEHQLTADRKHLAAPFEAKAGETNRKLDKYVAAHHTELDEFEGSVEKLENSKKQLDELIGNVLARVGETFGKRPVVEGREAAVNLIRRATPKLQEERQKKAEESDRLREKFKELVARNNTLMAHVKKADELAGKIKSQPNSAELAAEQKVLFDFFTPLFEKNGIPATLSQLRTLAVDQVKAVRALLDKVKAGFEKSDGLLKALDGILDSIRKLEALESEIASLEERHEYLSIIREERLELQRSLDAIESERDEKLCRIDEAIEVNRET
ncbi:MAG: hypothetical protein V1794_12945 [Candidatus Glassbacteria bacterium]